MIGSLVASDPSGVLQDQHDKGSPHNSSQANGHPLVSSASRFSLGRSAPCECLRARSPNPFVPSQYNRIVMCDHTADLITHIETRDATASVPYLTPPSTGQYRYLDTLTFHHLSLLHPPPTSKERARTSCLDFPYNFTAPTTPYLISKRDSQIDQRGETKGRDFQDFRSPNSLPAAYLPTISPSPHLQLPHRNLFTLKSHLLVQNSSLL